MGLYGPFTAVSGTVQECDVDPNAQALYIINTSIYDLALAFLPTKPASTTLYGGGYWYYNVPSGDRRGVRIPLGVYGGAGFPGYLFVMPVDNSGTVAFSGVKSANKLFTIESYADPLLLPPDYASPQRQDMSSQPRIIALPAGFNQWVTGQWTTGTTPGSTGIGLKFSLTSAQLAANNFTVYLNAFTLHSSTAPTTALADVSIAARFLNASNSVVGTDPIVQIVRCAVVNTAGGAVSHVDFLPPRPVAWFYNATIPATSTQVEVVLRLNGATATQAINYFVAAELDLVNLAPIGDIGTGTLFSFGQAAF